MLFLFAQNAYFYTKQTRIVQTGRSEQNILPNENTVTNESTAGISKTFYVALSRMNQLKVVTMAVTIF